MYAPRHGGKCLSFLLLVLLGVGCGSEGPPARPDIEETPEADLRGASAKALLYEFRAKVRKHGAKGVQQELPVLLENFEGYPQIAGEEQKATYQEIWDKLKAMEASVGGSPGKDELVRQVDEIGTLADKLPGKADPNPIVE